MRLKLISHLIFHLKIYRHTRINRSCDEILSIPMEGGFFEGVIFFSFFFFPSISIYAILHSDKLHRVHHEEIGISCIQRNCTAVLHSAKLCSTRKKETGFTSIQRNCNGFLHSAKLHNIHHKEIGIICIQRNCNGFLHSAKLHRFHLRGIGITRIQRNCEACEVRGVSRHPEHMSLLHVCSLSETPPPQLSMGNSPDSFTDKNPIENALQFV